MIAETPEAGPRRLHSGKLRGIGSWKDARQPESRLGLQGLIQLVTDRRNSASDVGCITYQIRAWPGCVRMLTRRIRLI
jgi:hypothetical protein